MRILHVTSHLNVGGVTKHLLTLAYQFQRRGHKVIIASGGGPLVQEATAHGISHWGVPLQTSVEFSPQVFRATQMLTERLQVESVDILHAHTRVGQVVAERLSRRCAIPYVATWHGFFRRNLGRRLWPCTGHLTIAISEPVRQHLLRDVYVPSERIRLIPHGIDTARFEAPVDPTTQAQARHQMGLPPGSIVVGTVSRLVPSKGVDGLLRSVPRIRALAPGARLLIIGDGPQRLALEQLAGQLGVRPAVHFAGALSDTRVALSLMRVFVFLPAEQEGFGLALLEAMASGCPIVAVRRGGGAPWVLDQGGVREIVEPGDAEGLAQSIARLLTDQTAASRAIADARAVVKERYSLQRMVDAVEAVYLEALAKWPRVSVRWSVAGDQ